MRVIMMGTGPFAVPTLKRLYDSPHEVLALVTRPPKPIHGKSRAEANPMRALAEERGTRVHDPQSINTPEARMVLASYRPDLLVVCDYGQILSPEVLELARWGGINLHASLLPKYRGAAPINWAIYNGETETGVTIIHMTPGLDAGPAIAQLSTPIGPTETTAELEPRLAELGAPAVLEAIDQLAAGNAKPIEQNSAQVTRAPRLKKEHGAVDWSRSAEAIANQVRALKPWPGTFTFWHRESGEPLRLILDTVAALPAAASGSSAPGTVTLAEQGHLHIATSAGQLNLLTLQPAGKRVLSAAEFLRGYGVQAGSRMGPV